LVRGTSSGRGFPPYQSPAAPAEQETTKVPAEGAGETI